MEIVLNTPIVLFNFIKIFSILAIKCKRLELTITHLSINCLKISKNRIINFLKNNYGVEFCLKSFSLNFVENERIYNEFVNVIYNELKQV